VQPPLCVPGLCTCKILLLPGVRLLTPLRLLARRYKQCHSVLQGLYEDGLKVCGGRSACSPLQTSAFTVPRLAHNSLPACARLLSTCASTINSPVRDFVRGVRFMCATCCMQGEKGEFTAYGLLYAAAAGAAVLNHEMKEALQDPGGDTLADFCWAGKMMC
jgi:hypothetical protein